MYCPSLWPPGRSRNRSLCPVIFVLRIGAGAGGSVLPGFPGVPGSPCECCCFYELLARICPVWLFGQFACPGYCPGAAGIEVPDIYRRIFTAGYLPPDIYRCAGGWSCSSDEEFPVGHRRQASLPACSHCHTVAFKGAGISGRVSSRSSD